MTQLEDRAPVLGRDVTDVVSALDIDVWPNPHPGSDSVVVISTEPGEVSALCPAVPGIQPDAYLLSLRYRPGKAIIEGKSFKLYLLTFRDRRISAEAMAGEICAALVAALDPVALSLDLDQNVRGGHRISVSARHNGGVSRDDV